MIFGGFRICYTLFIVLTFETSLPSKASPAIVEIMYGFSEASIAFRKILPGTPFSKIDDDVEFRISFVHYSHLSGIPSAIEFEELFHVQPCQILKYLFKI